MANLNGFLGTYDPGDITILINDQEVFGFAEGDMVTVEKNSPHFNVHVGTRGETTRAAIKDNNYTVTFRLQQTSPFVKYIEQLKAVDNVASVPPVATITIKDPSGYDGLVNVGQAWLMEDPTRSWGNEVGVREYQFYVVNGITSEFDVKGASNFASSIGLDI